MALGFGLFHCRRSGTHEGMSTVVCRSIATALAAVPHFVARQRPRNECQRLSAHAKAFSVTRRMAARETFNTAKALSGSDMHASDPLRIAHLSRPHILPKIVQELAVLGRSYRSLHRTLPAPERGRWSRNSIRLGTL